VVDRLATVVGIQPSDLLVRPSTSRARKLDCACLATLAGSPAFVAA
jgi:hypothetical protein